MRISAALNAQYQKTTFAHRIGFKADKKQNKQPDLSQSSAPKEISDTTVLYEFLQGNLYSLINQEKKGKIQNVNWNVTDSDGDNLLMIAFNNKHFPHFSELVKLANEGKIDVNYVNKGKYSLPQCAIMSGNNIYHLFELKNLDITKTEPGDKSEPIVKFAINNEINDYNFEQIVCHPSMDFSQYDIQDLFKYIDDSSKQSDLIFGEKRHLTQYQRENYKAAIKKALKIQNAKKAAQFYHQNGSMNLKQIHAHIDNVSSEEAINMPLTDLGGTIAHLLAEIHVNPEDTDSVEIVKNIIKKMVNNSCYFWKEDNLGRSPLMLALENKNIVVAKAMLEKMTKSEFRYLSDNQIHFKYACSVKQENINHLPALWNLIADLPPKDRKEVGLLFLERIKTYSKGQN